jgi:ketol-acid reductoisomerase
MRKLISDTAKWGELTVGPKIIDRTVQKRMKSGLQKIRSGQFAREFIREMKPPRTRYAQLLLDAEKHPIEKVGAIARNDGLAHENINLRQRCALAARLSPARPSEFWLLPRTVA